MSLELLKKHRFVGIMRHIRPEVALAAAKAMYEGGIRIFEITFDPSRETTVEETGGIIRQLREYFGDDVSVGAGTVLTVDYAKAAWEAGAQFIVAPNTDASARIQLPGHGLRHPQWRALLRCCNRPPGYRNGPGL